MDKFDAWYDDFQRTPEYKAGLTRDELALEAFDAGMEAKTAETLRDRFAMCVLTGLIQEPHTKYPPRAAAAKAYEYADAMLKQRDISRTCGNSD